MTGRACGSERGKQELGNCHDHENERGIKEANENNKEQKL